MAGMEVEAVGNMNKLEQSKDLYEQVIARVELSSFLSQYGEPVAELKPRQLTLF